MNYHLIANYLAMNSFQLRIPFVGEEVWKKVGNLVGSFEGGDSVGSVVRDPVGSVVGNSVGIVEGDAVG